MKISEKYIDGLKKAYFDNDAKETWEHFERVIHGAQKEDIMRIKDEFPSVPDSLLNLLEYVDGTYWREYQGENLAFYFLGSDVDEYPYYLLSSAEIIERKNEASFFKNYIERLYEKDGVVIDDKIINKADVAKWLVFSDCMNNGGTSSLFIDFTPSANGKIGQVLRFLHDPDEILVIADSFDDYLAMLMNNGYDFINEDSVLDLLPYNPEEESSWAYLNE